jgi:hypothetical protein
MTSDSNDLMLMAKRLLRRQEILAHRLALAKAAEQQLLVQAADLVARVQETELKATEIIEQAAAPGARRMAEQLKQFDAALLHTHRKAELAARKTQLILKLMERQDVRMQWLDTRRKLQRSMAPMQRSGSRACSSPLVNLQRRRIYRSDVARFRDGVL